MSVVGREAEVDALLKFLSAIPSGRASLRLRGLAEAEGRSYTVLTARPSSAETALSFAALGNMLGSVLDELAPHIPVPQQGGAGRRPASHGGRGSSARSAVGGDSDAQRDPVAGRARSSRGRGRR